MSPPAGVRGKVWGAQPPSSRDLQVNTHRARRGHWRLLAGPPPSPGALGKGLGGGWALDPQGSVGETKMQMCAGWGGVLQAEGEPLWPWLHPDTYSGLRAVGAHC